MSDKTCPNCGYCDKCGRGRGYQPAFYPWYGVVPPQPITTQPYWYWNTTTSGTSPNQSI